MIKAYYYLAKPGIIYGNAITTIAGFFLASKGQINWQLFLITLIGISLVMASACVFNNYIDRDIDVKMERTKNRALVTKQISVRNAMIYATILGLFGFIALYQHTNILATAIALIGFVIYVGVYSPLKKRSVYATLVGSLAGAVPPVVGFVAVSNKFDLGALLLFLILVAWQMPHFYAIAIRRLDEYKAAQVPVLPVKQGIRITKINIMIYIIIFIMMTILLTIFDYTGYIYLILVELAGLIWFMFAIQGFKKDIDDKAWARKMFLFSLIVLLTFSIMVSVDSFLK